MKKAMFGLMLLILVALLISCAASKPERIEYPVGVGESLKDLFKEETGYVDDLNKEDALALLFQPEEEITIFPKSTWFYFELGGSQLSKKDIARAQDIGNFLKQNPEYEIKGIYADADQRGWLKEGYSSDIDSITVVSFDPTDSTNAEVAVKIPIFGPLQVLTSKLSESKNKSFALDGGKMIICAQSVARAIGLRLFNFGYLTGHNKRAVLVVIGKKDTRLEDLRSETDSRLKDLEIDIADHNSMITSLKKESNLELAVGICWQGMICDQDRDLSAPVFGIRLSTNKYFVHLQGGINPKSELGYRNYYYRDILGSIMVGHYFYQNKKVRAFINAGGFIGWEAATNSDKFALRAMGGQLGLGAEYYFFEKWSVAANFNYLVVNTTDVIEIELEKWRHGISGSLGILFTF